MGAVRIVDAFCGVCDEMRPHVVKEADPGSCKCSVCGTVQQTYEPLSV